MINVSNISKAYGNQELFSAVTFSIGARDRIAVIGPNGSGKTTLFEILTNNIIPDSGTITRRKDITIGYSRQEISPFSHKTLLDDVSHASTQITGLAHRMQVLHDALTENGQDSDALLQELGELQHRFEATGGYNTEHDAELILSGLGFKKTDFNRPLSEFSGGWLMRVALAKLLMINPDLLLLDEPTNHLDLESCLWFEDYLKSYQGSLLVTSHDRAFLNRVARKVIAIEKDEVIFYSGGYDSYVAARQQDLETREATARKQEVKIKKEMRFIDRFRAKNTKATQVQSRIKRLGKMERIEVPRTTKNIHFSFPEPARSGEDVITLDHVFKAYNGNIVYPDLSLQLRRGDRIALTGPNGAGKTTLLKILAGVLSFEDGERKLGSNVTTAYYAQHQLELLDPNNTVLNEIKRVAPDDPEQSLRSLLGAFLFSGDDVQKKVEVLSGGEKSRLSIAKMLVRPANFLLMDEPTNHLDIASREILTDALDAYHGTLCFITHDRTLIREIANKIIWINNGAVTVFPGNYDDFISWKEARLPDDQTVIQQKYLSPRETTARELQRQRKIAEGELRNNYFRVSSPIKKRIGEIEHDLEKLEREFKDLENYFCSPELYGDAAEITAATKRHHELKGIISALSGEWEKLSVESERLKTEFEAAKRELETEKNH